MYVYKLQFKLAAYAHRTFSAKENLALTTCIVLMHLQIPPLKASNRPATIINLFRTFFPQYTSLSRDALYSLA